MLGALAMGLVMMPVLAAIGELHELAHDPSGTHALAGHADHSRDVPHGQNGQGEGEGGSDSLHALIHFAHCCGQSSLVSLPVILTTATPPSADVLPLPEQQLLHQASSLAPFRPPITT